MYDYSYVKTIFKVLTCAEAPVRSVVCDLTVGSGILLLLRCWWCSLYTSIRPIPLRLQPSQAVHSHGVDTAIHADYALTTTKNRST